MNEVVTKPVYVFVYGTLKQGFGNNSLLCRAKFVGKAQTISDHYTMFDGGFPTVVSKGLYYIKGELYKVVDQLTLDNLDRLEGVPHLFVRHTTTVKTEDGESYDAFMYVGASSREQRLLLSEVSQVIPNHDNICEWSR